MEEFTEACNNVSKITQHARIKSFQYKLLHCAILCNDTLEKWNVVKSALYTFCNNSTETVMHLLFGCHVVQNLWQRIMEIYLKKFEFRNPKITMVNVMLNNFHYEGKHVLNYIGLVYQSFTHVDVKRPFQRLTS